MTVLAYLRFVLADEADRDRYEGDLAAVRELAQTQPGHRWSEVRGFVPWIRPVVEEATA